MVTNFYTLRALVGEWRDLLVGSRLTGAYSHLPAELTVVFERASGSEDGLRISVRPGSSFVFRVSDPRRPRSNVTSLLDDAVDKQVRSISIAAADRIISIKFADGDRLEIHPYGSRANVYLVSDGQIVDAFKRADDSVGRPPPPARPAAPPESEGDLLAKLDELDGPVEKRLRRCIPTLTPELAREAVELGGGNPWDGLRLLWTVLDKPTPVVYETESGILLSIIELTHLKRNPIERFERMDDAVRWTVGRRSSRARLRDARADLAKALERAREAWERRVEQIERAMAAESRADEYEMWGHLLMANPHAEGERAEGGGGVMLSNIMDDGSPVTIALDPGRTIVENAQRYYERARKLREDRGHLADRLGDAQANLEAVGALISELAAAGTARDVEAFRKDHEADLRRFVGGRTEDVESAPFRRFTVTGGYEVWVGRNARENDRLTFGAAARHDLWFHARGVPGSHVVLRVPGRTEKVARPVIEAAAAIAAFYSGARGSSLVPVQMAQRKHVSKPRGAEAGVVRVTNEEVVLVGPRLPGRA